MQHGGAPFQLQNFSSSQNMMAVSVNRAAWDPYTPTYVSQSPPLPNGPSLFMHECYAGTTDQSQSAPFCDNSIWGRWQLESSRRTTECHFRNYKDVSFSPAQQYLHHIMQDVCRHHLFSTGYPISLPVFETITSQAKVWWVAENRTALPMPTNFPISTISSYLIVYTF